MKLIHALIILAAIVIQTFVILFQGQRASSDLYEKQLKQEQLYMDSLEMELNAIRRDGVVIQNYIDSLSAQIHESDSIITQKINRFRNETFYMVRNYRDSSYIGLLKRLRPGSD